MKKLTIIFTGLLLSIAVFLIGTNIFESWCYANYKLIRNTPYIISRMLAHTTNTFGCASDLQWLLDDLDRHP